MEELTAENVNELYRACLFKEGEEVLDPILVEGIVNKFAFDRAKIKRYEVEISEMLSNLPKEFHRDTGGGWSFLNACMTRSNTQWGEHSDIEKLMCLGIASGQVELLMPRDTWGFMPGGTPYFMVIPLSSARQWGPLDDAIQRCCQGD